ncbi:MAG: signal peptide peptidase SppA [Pseudomonadota bacterium]
MSLEVDALIDRRRMRRRIAFWRGLAVVAVIAALAAGAATQVDLERKHVARISVSGAIVADRPLYRLIDKLKKEDSVAAVLVSIDSPGGTSVGGERLYDALRDLAEEKPVVSHINTLGASAAYMTAMGTDHIVAQRTSLTGSIGVLIQYGQINDLLANLGITVRKVDSGPLKAEPNPFEAPDPAAVAVLQSVVDDTYAYFLGLVVERRDIPEPRARQLADGRIFTGAQALESGLIDAIGGEETAIAWLRDNRNVPAGIPTRTYKPSRPGNVPFFARLWDASLDRVFAAIGLPVPPDIPMTSVDGLWSIWHASDAVGAIRGRARE